MQYELLKNVQFIIYYNSFSDNAFRLHAFPPLPLPPPPHHRYHMNRQIFHFHILLYIYIYMQRSLQSN